MRENNYHRYGVRKRFNQIDRNNTTYFFINVRTMYVFVMNEMSLASEKKHTNKLLKSINE